MPAQIYYREDIHCLKRLTRALWPALRARRQLLPYILNLSIQSHKLLFCNIKIGRPDRLRSALLKQLVNRWFGGNRNVIVIITTRRISTDIQ